MRELLERLSSEGRRRALTHSSWASAPGESYERLEYLGDGVLGLAVANELFQRYPGEAEGVLSRLRAATVSREACAIVAREADLGGAMVEAAPVHVEPGLVRDMAGKTRVVAALAESVIGAAFLELGYDAVAEVVVAAFAERMELARGTGIDAKSELQEWAQRVGDSVEYEEVGASGPDHARTFTMQARLVRDGRLTTGEGTSKKAAEQLAARLLLDQLRADAPAPAPSE